MQDFVFSINNQKFLKVGNKEKVNLFVNFLGMWKNQLTVAVEFSFPESLRSIAISAKSVARPSTTWKWRLNVGIPSGSKMLHVILVVSLRLEAPQGESECFFQLLVSWFGLVAWDSRGTPK